MSGHTRLLVDVLAGGCTWYGSDCEDTAGRIEDR